MPYKYDKDGINRIVRNINITNEDFVREVLGNVKKNVNKLTINFVNNNLLVWCNDGGYNVDDKNNISVLAKTTTYKSASNNGIGIRMACDKICNKPTTIISFTDIYETYKYNGIKNCSEKWQKSNDEQIKLYKNNSINNESGTLTIYNIADEYKEILNKEKIKILIKKILQNKIKNSKIKILIDNQELKINTFIIPNKEKNKVKLIIAIGIGNKNKIFCKVKNYSELNKNCKKIVEPYIHIDKAKKIKFYNKIKKFKENKNVEVIIEVANVNDNLIDKIKKEYKTKIKDILGVHLSINDIYVLDKPFKKGVMKYNKIGSSDTNPLGKNNKLIANVNINYYNKCDKNEFYNLPPDKHNSKPTNKGLKFHYLIDYLFHKLLHKPKEPKESKESKKDKITKELIKDAEGDFKKPLVLKKVKKKRKPFPVSYKRQIIKNQNNRCNITDIPLDDIIMNFEVDHIDENPDNIKISNGQYLWTPVHKIKTAYNNNKQNVLKKKSFEIMRKFPGFFINYIINQFEKSKYYKPLSQSVKQKVCSIIDDIDNIDNNKYLKDLSEINQRLNESKSDNKKYQILKKKYLNM